MVKQKKNKFFDYFFRQKTLVMAIAAIAVIASCTRSPNVGHTPDTKWYTNNPDADTFYIATANELAGLAQLVNADTSHIVTADEMAKTDDEIGQLLDEMSMVGMLKKNKLNFNGKTIILTNDIDLSPYGKNSVFNNGNGWIPIGHCGDEDYECYWPFEFNGTFDGNGKKISGLYSKQEARGDHEGRLTYVPGGLFGNVSGTVRNLGVAGAEVDGGGGIVGTLRGGTVSNCYLSGRVEGDGGIVGWMLSGGVSNGYFTGTVKGAGGIVGSMENGHVSNCYSAGTIIGETGTGGIVGTLDGDSSRVSNCYSTAVVNGTGSVGGIVGYVSNLVKTEEYQNIRIEYMNESFRNQNNGDGNSLSRLYERFYKELEAITLFDTLNSSVSNCVALNPNVNGGDSSNASAPFVTLPSWEEDQLSFYNRIYRAYDSSFSRGGRVVGGSDGGRLSGNAAFSGIADKDGNAKWNDKTALSINGADITAAEIKSDGTLGGRFTAANGWTIENGKLPGIGAAVDLPEHLR